MVDGDDLPKQLLDILHAIPVNELERAFTAWIDRLREASEGNDDYNASSKTSRLHFSRITSVCLWGIYFPTI
jgi:hypothetical protein